MGFVLVAVAATAIALVLAPRARAGVDHRSAAQVDVGQIYLADCAICHGSDGKGTNRAPSLVGVGRASLDYYLTTGRMPITNPAVELANPRTPISRHKPYYSPPTIIALEDHILALTGGGGLDIPIVDPHADRAPGGDLFRLQCAACHAWAADGGALLHIEAPSLHDATPTQIAEAVRVGPGQMPGFGTAAIDDHQLSQIVNYVTYLRHPQDRGGDPLWHLGPFSEGAIAWICGLALLIVTIRWIGEKT